MLSQTTKMALACQRDEILRYVEANSDSRYSRVDFAALSEKANKLDEMLEQGIEPTPTAITYADLMDAFMAKWAAKSAYDEVCEPYKSLRHAISCTMDWIRRAERHNDERIDEERKKLEEYREEFDANYLSDEFNKKVDALAVADRYADNVWNTVRRLHVKQCEEIALRALLEDTSWTRQPTRYKRMRAKAEAIANAALLGTGCTLSVYESGSMHINHDWAAFFTHVEHAESIELPSHDYGDDMPNLDRMRSNLERMEKHDGYNVALSFTYEQVKALINDVDGAMVRLKSLHDEYVERAKEIIAPFDALGLDGDNLRGYHTSLKKTAIVESYQL